MSVWDRLRCELEEVAMGEPLLCGYIETEVLSCGSLQLALATVLGGRLASRALSYEALRSALIEESRIDESMVSADLLAVASRDPAARGISNPFLNHKGFHALQVHRIAHSYWCDGRKSLALHLQSRSSEVFAVDIHPAARIGRAIFIDHATGVVIGETTVIEDDVSMLQGVTLGGTGKETGVRHPTIGRGVLICAGAKILGNIRIGEGSVVVAGSVVLEEVPPHSTVVGVPARVIGKPAGTRPALNMDQNVERQVCA